MPDRQQGRLLNKLTAEDAENAEKQAMKDRSRVVITVRVTPRERRRINQAAARLSLLQGSHVSTNVLCREAILRRVAQIEGQPAELVPQVTPPRAPVISDVPISD